MNRRGFFKLALGAGSAAVVNQVAPSLVWPFRKIFLPPAPQPYQLYGMLYHQSPGRVDFLNLESWGKVGDGDLGRGSGSLWVKSPLTGEPICLQRGYLIQSRTVIDINLEERTVTLA